MIVEKSGLEPLGSRGAKPMCLQTCTHMLSKVWPEKDDDWMPGVCFFILPSIWRVYFERKLEILGYDWLRHFNKIKISLERNREFLWVGENFFG
ncbi:hypothetical protein ACSBR1_019808 [Camellia fascicularis]